MVLSFWAATLLREGFSEVQLDFYFKAISSPHAGTGNGGSRSLWRQRKADCFCWGVVWVNWSLSHFTFLMCFQDHVEKHSTTLLRAPRQLCSFQILLYIVWAPTELTQDDCNLLSIIVKGWLISDCFLETSAHLLYTQSCFVCLFCFLF